MLMRSHGWDRRETQDRAPTWRARLLIRSRPGEGPLPARLAVVEGEPQRRIDVPVLDLEERPTKRGSLPDGVNVTSETIAAIRAAIRHGDAITALDRVEEMGNDFPDRAKVLDEAVKRVTRVASLDAAGRLERSEAKVSPSLSGLPRTPRS